MYRNPFYLIKTRFGAQTLGDSSEKDGFHAWHYLVEGEKTTRAKYISFVDDVLTLEKPDGSKMTIEYKNLNELNQNYIRRRVELEKLTPEEQAYFKQLRLELTKPRTDK